MTNPIALLSLSIMMLPAIAFADETPILATDRSGGAIEVDGAIDDWAGVPAIKVPLEGRSKVDEVELRAAIRDDRIYVLAIWADKKPHELHKPLEWDDASQSYKKQRAKEDRFAVSWLMSGEFSEDKTSGSEFEADVWHWKAERSNKAGLVHDKWWKMSRTPFEKASEFETPDGSKIYIGRFSDKGDRLYSSVKYDKKRDDVMSRYEINTSASGSIADVSARGVWSNGMWRLEMSRSLDTGHADDAIIPSQGMIQFAVAAFDNKDGVKHSTSTTITLDTRQAGSTH